MSMPTKLSGTLIRPLVSLYNPWHLGASSSRYLINGYCSNSQNEHHKCGQRLSTQESRRFFSSSSSSSTETAASHQDSMSDSSQSSQSSNNNNNNHDEGLEKVHQILAHSLPDFFRLPHDFRIYREDVVFEDNIRKVNTAGLKAYAWQIASIKMGAHFKYGKVNMEVLKITSHPEDRTVRVRWRVVTVPGNSIILAFWKFKIWNSRESVEQYRDDWIDGFSIFHCDTDGKVFKHVADKVIPDSNVDENKSKPNLAMKVALALGLVSGDTVGRLAEGFDFIREIIWNSL